MHALSQLRDRLQSEQQALQTKLREAASAKERLQGTLLEVTSRLKVSERNPSEGRVWYQIAGEGEKHVQGNTK